MKDSFMAKPDGKLAVGPGFIMEKMNAGFSKATMNWKYIMIMPNGRVFGCYRRQELKRHDILSRMPWRG